MLRLPSHGTSCSTKKPCLALALTALKFLALPKRQLLTSLEGGLETLSVRLGGTLEEPERRLGKSLRDFSVGPKKGRRFGGISSEVVVGACEEAMTACAGPDQKQRRNVTKKEAVRHLCSSPNRGLHIKITSHIFHRPGKFKHRKQDFLELNICCVEI